MQPLSASESFFSPTNEQDHHCLPTLGIKDIFCDAPHFGNNCWEYTGEKVDDQKHGLGVLEFCDGSKYEGKFKNNQFHGIGKLTFANGETYFGNWSRNNKQGVGIYLHANGMKYKGEWKRDKKNGLGRTEWPSGDCHIGKYTDGF